MPTSLTPHFKSLIGLDVQCFEALILRLHIVPQGSTVLQRCYESWGRHSLTGPEPNKAALASGGRLAPVVSHLLAG